MNDTIPAELGDPISGEAVDTSNVDSLCEAPERIREDESRLKLFKQQCVQALTALTTTQAHTRYAEGSKFKAKIVMPAKTFYQPSLRELVNAYPKIAPEYIRPSGYSVNMRPYGMLAKTTITDPAKALFAKMLTEAERDPVALPWVTVEVKCEA